MIAIRGKHKRVQKREIHNSNFITVLVEGEEPVATEVVRPPSYGPPPPNNSQQIISPEYPNNDQPGPYSNQQYPDPNYGTIQVSTEQAYNPPTTVVARVEYQVSPPQNLPGSRRTTASMRSPLHYFSSILLASSAW